MSSENGYVWNTLREFQQQVVDSDHAEALLVNEIFDSSPGVSPESAIGAAHKRLAKEMGPTAEKLGYPVVRDAYRWWNFKTAFLRDVELIYDDETPDDPAAAETLAEYQHNKDSTGELLLRGTAYYMEMYALLERQRVGQQRVGENWAVNPFETERASANLLLQTVQLSHFLPDLHQGLFPR